MSTFLVWAGLHLVCLLLRDVYELLKKAERIDTRDTRVFATVFTSMVTMWVAWFAMGLTDPTRVVVPVWVRWLGIAVVVLAFGLAVGGMAALRGVENIDHLVTSGVYSRIRHPMYLGFILLILGWSLAQGAPLSLAIGTPTLLSILWWRQTEEHEMTSTYGDEYTDYSATTWW